MNRAERLFARPALAALTFAAATRFSACTSQTETQPEPTKTPTERIVKLSSVSAIEQGIQLPDTAFAKIQEAGKLKQGIVVISYQDYRGSPSFYLRLVNTADRKNVQDHYAFDGIALYTTPKCSGTYELQYSLDDKNYQTITLQDASGAKSSTITLDPRSRCAVPLRLTFSYY